MRSVDLLLHHARALQLFRESGLRIDSADLFYSRFKPGQNAMLGFLFSGRDESGAPIVLPGYVRTFADGRARTLIDKWESKKIRTTPLA